MPPLLKCQQNLTSGRKANQPTELMYLRSDCGRISLERNLVQYSYFDFLGLEAESAN